MKTPLPSGNPQLPDTINNQDTHPLADFLWLAAGLLGALILLMLVLAFAAHWLGPKLPYQWERQWLSGNNPAQTEESASAAAGQQALQQLLDKLLQQEAEPLPVSVHWLPDEALPNAFATLGGHIFITQGLVQQVSSENALAMVLAHEYAHIEQRHPAILLLEQLSFMVLATLMGSDVAGTLGQHTGMLTIMAFSRDMERDADARALQLLQQHYGHTGGASEFFDNMLQQRDEPGWTAMFQTHPLTAERIERIAATQPGSGALTPLPAIFKTR